MLHLYFCFFVFLFSSYLTTQQNWHRCRAGTPLSVFLFVCVVWLFVLFLHLLLLNSSIITDTTALAFAAIYVAGQRRLLIACIFSSDSETVFPLFFRSLTERDALVTSLQQELQKLTEAEQSKASDKVRKSDFFTLCAAEDKLCGMKLDTLWLDIGLGL